MNLYFKAGVITLAVLALIFAVVWFLDDSRISSLDEDVDALALQSESNRVLFFYNQVFNPTESTAFCEVLDKSATIRSDAGDTFFSKLGAYENANLLGNYDSLKKKYLLNRIELWLYTTLLVKNCNTNIQPVLFFYRTKSACPECQVQGEILEEVRSECPNVKIFAVSVDESVDLVPLIQAQFNVVQTPALVVNNRTRFDSLTNKTTVLESIACETGVILETGAPLIS